jgi:hypothetical protein
MTPLASLPEAALTRALDELKIDYLANKVLSRAVTLERQLSDLQSGKESWEYPSEPVAREALRVILEKQSSELKEGMLKVLHALPNFNLDALPAKAEAVPEATVESDASDYRAMRRELVWLVFTDASWLATPVGRIEGLDSKRKTVVFRVPDAYVDESRFEIPSAKIAGVLSLEFVESIGPFEGKEGVLHDRNVHSRFEKLFFKYIRANGVEVREGQGQRQQQQQQQQVAQQQQIRIASLKFSRDTAVYCDWSYLAQRAGGGLKSIGVGLPGLSFSAGWNSTLWQSFRARVIASVVPLEEAPARDEVCVSAYMTLLTGSHSQNLEMEGSSWCPVLLTTEKVTKYTDVLNRSWLLAYLREDCFMLPKDLWELIVDPIQIYGEMIAAEIGTEFGMSKSFFKVRAAAHIEFS